MSILLRKKRTSGISFYCGIKKAVESGQATAEYALLTLWTVIIVLSTFQALRFAILDFYYDVTSFLCLPIP